MEELAEEKGEKVRERESRWQAHHCRQAGIPVDRSDLSVLREVIYER